ncbi:unnamed protein product [Symbiodinium necroappetens]|uniref:Uncharacterized protein n=1 Tax=Symbiodinium necroappetens TaxID=1628268 RepID=A0A813BU81_9DINO|nr:unnamed protein product [Symbiodinium necroappetens]
MCDEVILSVAPTPSVRLCSFLFCLLGPVIRNRSLARYGFDPRHQNFAEQLQLLNFFRHQRQIRIHSCQKQPCLPDNLSKSNSSSQHTRCRPWWYASLSTLSLRPIIACGLGDVVKP